MSRLLFVAIGLLGLAACSDPDHDGLSNKDEKAIGTDRKNPDTDGDGVSDGDEVNVYKSNPLVADTDGDGLTDGDEVNTYHTDPTIADTDGDGYSDFAEVQANHSPTDAKDKIYVGNWPYNTNKDAIKDPGLGGSIKVGKNFADVQFVDQFGDTVDLYDFAGQGKAIVIDASTQWCCYCNEAAKMLDGQSSFFDAYPQYSNLGDMVKNGDIYWVTILDEDNNGAAPTQETSNEWYKDHKNKHIPILADDAHDGMVSYMGVAGWPTMVLVEDNMKVAVSDPNNYTAVWDELESRFGSKYPTN